MKDAIVNILEGVLILFVIAVTLVGFIVAGEGGPFGDFNIGRALLGGLGGLLFAVLSSGVVFVLLVIRDQQSEQIQLLRQIQRNLGNSEVGTGRSRLSSVESVATSSAPRLSSPPPSAGSSLRRCKRCNTILNSGASECQSCGTPVSA